MIFWIIAAIFALIVSFVVALLSLIREQGSVADQVKNNKSDGLDTAKELQKELIRNKPRDLHTPYLAKREDLETQRSTDSLTGPQEEEPFPWERVDYRNGANVDEEAIIADLTTKLRRLKDEKLVGKPDTGIPKSEPVKQGQDERLTGIIEIPRS